MTAIRWFMGDTWQPTFARWYVGAFEALFVIAALRWVIR